MNCRDALRHVPALFSSPFLGLWRKDVDQCDAVVPVVEGVLRLGDEVALCVAEEPFVVVPIFFDGEKQVGLPPCLALRMARF